MLLEFRRIAAVAQLNGRILLTDPAPLLILTLMPLVLMAFFQPMAKLQLQASGMADASGAEQTVPGMAVLFSFFSVAFLGTLFFREHAWGTWDRLRAGPARAADIILGKCIPAFVVQSLQLTVLWLAGVVLFGLRPRGSVLGLIAVTLALSLAILGVGAALVAFCRTMDQMMAAANLGAMLLGGLGGAITATAGLPRWARAVSPWTPQYWALEGYHRVVATAGGLSSVAVPCAVLLAVGAGGALVAALRFRMSDAKVGTT